MASNPFNVASKAGRPSVRPKPRPDPRPLPRTPTPFPRRRPNRDPRDVPVRPGRRRPSPRIPKGPVISPNVKWSPIAFGKKPPYTFYPKYPARIPPWLRRMMPPWIGGALMLGAWYFWEGGYKMPPGWIKCWDAGLPKQMMSGPSGFNAGTCDTGASDYLLGYQVPSGEYGDPIIIDAWPYDLSVWFGPCEGGGTWCGRMIYSEKWRRIGGGPFTVIPYSPPGVGPAPVPDLAPWIGPHLNPWTEPLPWAPPVSPIRRVNPSPDPTPEPSPQPEVAPGVVPSATFPTAIPSIDVDTSRPGVEPGRHFREPPGPGDRERKKRLTGSAATRWLQRLVRLMGSYNEVDDFVAALYQGLNWKVRRWRGRDGVWRDRDITTADRLSRIYELFGEFDMNKAIGAVLVDQGTDAAIGRVGQYLARRARELGEQGLWAGTTGFQRGNALTRAEWETMYQQLKAQQAKYLKKVTYKVRYYDEVSNSWYWVEKTRPVTQIPWFRQESNYPGLARPGMGEYWDLTEEQKRLRVRTVRRWYYAAAPSDRKIFFPGEEVY